MKRRQSITRSSFERDDTVVVAEEDAGGRTSVKIREERFHGFSCEHTLEWEQEMPPAWPVRSPDEGPAASNQRTALSYPPIRTYEMPPAPCRGPSERSQ